MLYTYMYDNNAKHCNPARLLFSITVSTQFALQMNDSRRIKE